MELKRMLMAIKCH